MVKKKKTSRRQGLGKKYMVQKKVKAHKKKLSKEAKKRKQMGIFKRKRKDLKIPNSWVGKEKLLREEIALRKQEMDAEEQRVSLKKLRREAARLQRANLASAVDNSAHDLEMANADAQKQTQSLNKVERRQHYRRELNKLVEACDVIIQVLDARDPLACRCRELETKIASLKSDKVDSSKKLILLLNKVDLIPSDVLSKWVRVLRREYPVIAFKASTQSQKRNIGRNKTFLKTMSKNKDTTLTSKCIGAEALLGLLKNYCRSLNLKTSITVGLIGYPNVGKSSIINSLKRQRAVGTSSTPGFTQTLQEVKLDKNIFLIDSPGVILNEGDDESSLVLKNCVKLQDIDAVGAVHNLVSRVTGDKLMEHYGIPAYKDGDQFLFHIAKLKGKLKSGGVPDLEQAARFVLQDWNKGKIAWFSRPPEIDESKTEATVVQNWGKEFKLDELLNLNANEAIMEVDTHGGGRTFVALS